MSTVIDRAVATAQRLITQNGEPCTWVQSSPSTIPDPAKPLVKANGVLVSVPVSILFTSGSSPLAQLLAGSSVIESGQTAIMPSVGFTPKLSDKVTRSDGSKIGLKSLNPVKPNGTIVLWKLVFES